ncbi:MAG: hypothetical protein EOM24_02795, partial [Chloroflexia bacterium]|nr:hypothetical protein [Chloroflexia bacterium]
MPYDQLEEIQNRRSEKIAMFLTLENAVGLILIAVPVYLLSYGFPGVLRISIVLLAALLGIGLTIDINGLPPYTRLLWAGRGWLERRLNGDRITPNHLPGTASSAPPDRPLPRGGPIRRRRMPAPIVAPSRNIQPMRIGSTPRVATDHLAQTGEHPE